MARPTGSASPTRSSSTRRSRRFVVLHGTDTMAYTASALSFLLDGIDVPIVLTGSQRPVTELRSDGRENLVTALAIAAGTSAASPGPRGDDLLRRRAAARQPGREGPRRQLPGIRLAQLCAARHCRRHDRLRRDADRPPARTAPPNGGISGDVTGLRLHPGLDGHVCAPSSTGPGCEAWSSRLRCRQRPAGRLVPRSAAGGRRSGGHGGGHHAVPGRQRDVGLYATGSALLATGAIPGGDMTFEAALTKLMVLADRHDPDDVRRLMQDDLAGELTVSGNAGKLRGLVWTWHRVRVGCGRDRGGRRRRAWAGDGDRPSTPAGSRQRTRSPS